MPEFNRREYGHGYFLSAALEKQIINYACKCHAKIAFNPGTAHLREGVAKMRELLRHTEIIFVNREEAEMLVGDSADIPGLLYRLHELGPHIAVITDGKNGAYASDSVNVYNQPIFYRRTGKSSATGSYDSITFIPTPSGAYQVTLNYVPTPTYLVNSTDTFDGVCGFEEIPVLSAAIKLLHKQGKFTDAAALQSERERLRDDARSFLGAGDQGAPERVQDVSVSYDVFGRPSY